jgi:hypothetical protein
VARAMDHLRLSILDDPAPQPDGFAAILGYSLGNNRPGGRQQKRNAPGQRRICQPFGHRSDKPTIGQPFRQPTTEHYCEQTPA